MPRIILLLAIAAVLYILYRRARSVPPHRRRAEYIKLGLAVMVAIVAVLTITGKMHWLGVAATGLLVALRALLPTLVRLFPMLASRLGGAATGQASGPGRTSTVETALLRMQLAHDSGDLHGEVLAGDFKGWHLADMNREQLDTLLAYCLGQDQESARLLDSYLQQRFPGGGLRAGTTTPRAGRARPHPRGSPAGAGSRRGRQPRRHRRGAPQTDAETAS